MLDSGEFATMAKLARREGIAVSYLTRVPRLTLLAPEIVEPTLDGQNTAELKYLLKGFSWEWSQQTATCE